MEYANTAAVSVGNPEALNLKSQKSQIIAVFAGRPIAPFSRLVYFELRKYPLHFSAFGAEGGQGLYIAALRRFDAVPLDGGQNTLF